MKHRHMSNKQAFVYTVIVSVPIHLFLNRDRAKSAKQWAWLTGKLSPARKHRLPVVTDEQMTTLAALGKMFRETGERITKESLAREDTWDRVVVDRSWAESDGIGHLLQSDEAMDRHSAHTNDHTKWFPVGECEFCDWEREHDDTKV